MNFDQCERCLEHPPTHRVRSEILNQRVCASCAWQAALLMFDCADAVGELRIEPVVMMPTIIVYEGRPVNAGYLRN